MLPCYVFVVINLILTVFVFAGREFTGVAQTDLYWSCYVCYAGVWNLCYVILFFGHRSFRHRKNQLNRGRRRLAELSASLSDLRAREASESKLKDSEDLGMGVSQSGLGMS